LGDGGMSDGFEDEMPQKWFGLTRVWWLAISLIIGIIVIMKIMPERVAFVNPKIVAQPFVWPEGCEKKQYEEEMPVHRECISELYNIGDGRKWGWKSSSKLSSYYRVGNDAIFPICNDNCKVLLIIKDVFITDIRLVTQNGM
jgi:hypothetical protein